MTFGGRRRTFRFARPAFACAIPIGVVVLGAACTRRPESQEAQVANTANLSASAAATSAQPTKDAQAIGASVPGGDAHDADTVAPQRVVSLPGELAHIKLAGGSGADCDHAVQIENARGSVEATLVEREWLRQVHPGARKKEHGLGHQNERVYDAYELITPDGGVVRACFDITAYVGEP